MEKKNMEQTHNMQIYAKTRDWFIWHAKVVRG